MSANEQPRARPPWVRAVGWSAGAYVLLTASLIAGGLIVTHLLAGSVGRWDDHVNAWFAAHRSDAWNRLTGDLTLVANAPGIAVAAVLAAGGALWRRRVRLALVLVVGLAIELACFLTSNYVVRRPRPSVPHLGSTPSTYSWPSGHVAATLVTYGAIVLIAATLCRGRWPVACWSLAAVLLTLAVGVSRVYRGDHHPSDALAGVVLGAGALWAARNALEAPAPPSAPLHSPERPVERERVSTP